MWLAACTRPEAQEGAGEGRAGAREGEGVPPLQSRQAQRLLKAQRGKALAGVTRLDRGFLLQLEGVSTHYCVWLLFSSWRLLICVICALGAQWQLSRRTMYDVQSARPVGGNGTAGAHRGTPAAEVA